MTNPADQVEIITSVQRRRRWTASEKVRIVEETFEPGSPRRRRPSRKHGHDPGQKYLYLGGLLFRSRPAVRGSRPRPLEPGMFSIVCCPHLATALRCCGVSATRAQKKPFPKHSQVRRR